MTALQGKVAIVTGASSGIGRATAKLFAQEGARVMITARRHAELDSLASEIALAGGKVGVLAGDIRHEDFAKALVEKTEEKFGGVDIAFNNAGTLGAMGATPDVSLASWTETIDTNLTGAFLGAKHQLSAMLRRGGGSMIFTSTFVGYTAAFPGMAAYAASKAGLIGLVQALAVEFGHKGIRVNAILPGGTDTPMGRAAASTPEALLYIQGLHALKRIATPEEQARSVLYLASDASSFTTGSALLVDGGVSINRA
jgi:NAD(P)-dependent dehydrogenase (short-subunit alcohol dehydrogenase family)